MTRVVKTLDQRRAEFAWQAATQGMARHTKTYKPLAKGAPFLIMGSGLMPTLAFLEGKGKGKGKDVAERVLREQIQEWLVERLAARQCMQPPPQDYQALMHRLQQGTSTFYMEATDESLAILKWIRQFVDAVDSGGSST